MAADTESATPQEADKSATSAEAVVSPARSSVDVSTTDEQVAIEPSQDDVTATMAAEAASAASSERVSEDVKADLPKSEKAEELLTDDEAMKTDVTGETNEVSVAKRDSIKSVSSDAGKAQLDGQVKDVAESADKSVDVEAPVTGDISHDAASTAAAGRVKRSSEGLLSPHIPSSRGTSAIYSTDAALPAARGQPVHRNSQISVTSSSDSALPAGKPTIVHGVVLVGFNHALGPTVEYSCPANLRDDPEIQSKIPFLALPDGAHMREEDYSCFHMYIPNVSPETIYGISCIRQLRADDLKNKSSDVTRSTVQKAVVVLANKPIFGPVRDKLGVVTRTFFAQKDFHDTQILDSFLESLEHAMQDEDQTSEAAIYMAMSLREFVWKFRMQTLTLFKLLLLQKRVLFFGAQVERLCAFQYALISMIPLLLSNLHDAAVPELDTRAAATSKPSSLRTSDRRSLLTYAGLPLNLFGKDAFFQPYFPLQQLDLLKCHSYLIGTTNSIIQTQRDCRPDVIVNVDTAAIEFAEPKVTPLVHLTAADRKWMDEIVRVIETQWDPQDPHRMSSMGFKGSDDWLRSKFEEYVCSALATIKLVDHAKSNPSASSILSETDATGMASFNEAWAASLRTTAAFKLWDANTDPVLFDLIEPRHPCEGQANVLDDVGIRLTNSLHSLHLDERLAPASEAISKGIATGSEGIWKAYSSLRTDIAKRQADYQAKRDKEALAAPKDAPDAGQAADSQKLLSTHVIAGAAEVGGRAASLATSFGSFLNSKLAKPKDVSSIVPTSTPPLSAATLLPVTHGSEDKTLDSPGETLTPSQTSRPSFFPSFRSVSFTSPPSQSQPKDRLESFGGTSPSSVAATSLSPTILGSFWARKASGTTPAPAVAKTPPVNEVDITPVGTTYPPAAHAYAANEEELLEGLAEANAAWAKAQAEYEAEEAAKSKRKSLSMGSDRSSVDMMSDVKL